MESTTGQVPQSASPHPPVSKAQTAAIIFCITCITAIGNLLAGLLTVSIPVIAIDLQIPQKLQLWPASAFALACGCTLLLCATISDVLGCRRTLLVGALVQSASSLGSGLCKSGIQLITLRTLAGVAASLCLPSAVAIASRSFPATTMHHARNVAFAAMGAGQAVGFGLGLVLGGVFSDTIGWRWGFYTATILNGLVIGLAFGALPTSIDGGALQQAAFARLKSQVDWVGALLISVSLALLSYILAVATGEDAGQLMKRPANLTMLCLSLVLLPVFSKWVHYQTKHGRPALIPNSLWQNVPFSSVCGTVFLVWGSLNASEQLTAFYLQDVRGFSTLASSLYFLPAPICGALMNAAIAVTLPFLKASLAVPIACLVSGLAPILLATTSHVDGPSYWRGVFQAMALNPLGADLIYTIANLVLTDAFPTDMQALAGGVFNMVAQVGKSVGIATTAIISQQFTASERGLDSSKALLLHGYKAGWWYNFVLGCTASLVSLYGLRSVGKLGMKRD